MRFFVGPCVIEGRSHAIETGLHLAAIAGRLDVPLYYKSSFDKANRSSAGSPRGPGLAEGLDILAAVKESTGLPIITDVHECWQVDPVAQVADVIQIPAFLCRQTDLVSTAAATGKPLLIKKGQFMSADEMAHVAAKARDAAPDHASLPENVMLCERGTTFGYNDLVVDMRSLARMRQFGHPVIFDASHAVQRPGLAGGASGGNRDLIPVLARAAAAAGIEAALAGS